YGEDIDLCWKCHAAGLTNYYLPSVQIVHHGGGSTQRQRSRFADVMIPESVSRLLRKTRGAVYAVGYRLALTTAACVRLAALMLWLPYAALRARTREWMSVFAKWAAILRWGMGFEKWASGSRSRD
ncbi:MAG: glycosyltransferase family 2 protein, partial [Thermoanaerobaculia bacterium]